ncbi:major capsid protein [Bartonella sp. DGB2]|uniref:major capsid protein n=1 Tax=Bartonella sp. DGB2 TaxID=3388426 RepID=UPI00398FE8C7
MVNIFSTFVLNRTVEYLERPASFLLDTFFGSIQTEEAEEIHFDIDQSKPRLAPFVSPFVAGRVVANEGFTTQSFKPAYVKDKRRFDANTPLKRSIGEKIGGALPANRRLEAAVARALRNQVENLTRREEVMAAEALTKGTVTVSGEDYPTKIVDFKRDPALTLALTGAVKWSNIDAPALDHLEDWAGLIQEKSGAVARHVIMDPKAWRHFRKNKQVIGQLEIRRGTAATISTDPIIRGQGQEKARYVGSIGDFDFYVYNDVYINDNGQLRHLLPDATVVLVSREQLEGTRCYGMIMDEKASFKAVRYFSKSWLEEDPAVRWLLLQSAPLIVPYRPNASLCATVA